MSNESEEPSDWQDLSKSRTVAIVNASALTREVVQAPVSTLNHSSESYNNKIIDEKYKILALLGQGGMGAVYLAHHLRLNKEVALKTFHEKNLKDDNWQRFQREAQSIGKLQHKNIVQVFDFGITGTGTPYYTMEVLQGENVAERIDRKGQLDIDEAITIFRELCEGLSICHQRKIVHRDIKPANIFLELKSTTNDTIQRVKLVDFGIAALVDDTPESQRLTAVGTVFGSPLYMSPEQGMGLKVDSRSDIYSAGCALFEMLTGVPPFRAPNAFATMLCHQQAALPTLASTNERNGGNGNRSSYPEWLEGLVASMLAKDPAARVQTVQELQDVIDYNWQTSESKAQSGPNEVTKERASVKRDQSLDLARDNTTSAIGTSSGPSKALLAAAIAGITFTSLIAFTFIGVALRDGDKNTKALNQTTSAKKQVTPYRQPSNDGKIHFHFPSPSLGKIGQGNELINVEAEGDVAIPAGPAVFFRARQRVVENPELLQGFAKDDLRTLVLDQIAIGQTWKENTTKNIHHLKSLHKFSAPISDLPKESIADLNELPLLEDLVIEGASLTGHDLLKLNRLSDLHYLSFSGTSDCSPVLKKLAEKNNLLNLCADECGLTDEDMLVIGKMTNLERLEISSNNITNQNISVLLKLPHLQNINLTGNAVTAEVLPILLKLKPETAISMPRQFWTAATAKAMRARFKTTNEADFDQDQLKNIPKHLSSE